MLATFVSAVMGSVVGWGMRNTGTTVSGPVILISAMSVLIRALRVWSVPELMRSLMWSAISVRVAGSGISGTAAMVVMSSSRRAVSWWQVSRSSVSRGPTIMGSIVPVLERGEVAVDSCVRIGDLGAHRGQFGFVGVVFGDGCCAADCGPLVARAVSQRGGEDNPCGAATRR
ncbi:hypothetical protein ACQP06_13935 [Nocardia sp. CA-136227]|uniref:hypothetical protein n=1 Tax=Nocardia sp. CA-136227 TaxID=3239979 RepID=UPI003D97FDD6